MIDPTCTLHTVYVGESHFLNWQVFLHGTLDYEDDGSSKESFLKGGELVRIKHSQINAYLSSSVCFHGRTPEVYFRNYNGAHDAEHQSLNSIWEISHNRILRQAEPFSAENNSIILRHYNSGRVIQVDPKSGKLSLQMLDRNYNHSKPDDLVEFSPLQLGTRKIRSGLSYKIKHTSHKGDVRFLSQAGKYCSMEVLDNKEETFKLREEAKFEPLEDHFYDETRLVAYFSDDNKVEEAYIIEKVDQSEIKDIMFMRSAMLDILEVARFFKRVKIQNKNSKSRSIRRIDNQKLVDTEYLLKRITCYLYDVEYIPDVDYKEEQFENMDPIEHRQRILKDLNYLEILVDLIHYPLANGHYEINDVHNELYIPDMLTTAYICIRNGIQEYRPNELYASQWLDLMINYSLGELDEKIQANETLTELIDNNQRILDTRIKRETISKFIYNLIKDGGDSKFVHILRAICICDDKPMLKNQNIITEILLQDRQVRNQLVLPLKCEKKIVKILRPDLKSSPSRSEEWILLSTIKEEEGLGEKYFDYYCSFIQLLGDLCQDRNYYAIQTLKEYFTDEICIQVITSNLYDNKLRSAFCKLTENLLIDAKPFMQLKIPSNIKNWSRIKNTGNSVLHGANKNSEQIAKYSALIEFVFKYMEDFNQIEDWEESCDFTLQIIQLCSKMLNVGFISEEKKLRLLFKNLCIILDKTDEEIKKNSKKYYDGAGSFQFTHSNAQIPDNALSIKKRACELIRVLLQIQTDLRLEIIMEEYQGLNPGQKNSGSSGDMNHTENKEVSKESDEPVAINGGQKNQVRRRKSRRGSKIVNQEMKGNLEHVFTRTVTNKDKYCFISKDSDQFIYLILTQCLYNSSELKRIAMELIYFTFRESETLRSRIKDIQIIHLDKSIAQLEYLEEISENLFVNGESMEIWYNNNDEKQIKSLFLLVQRLELMLDQNENYSNINIRKEKIIGTKYKTEISQILDNNKFLETFLDQSFENISKFQQDLTRNTSCMEYLIDIMENSFNGQENSVYSTMKKNITFKIVLILSKCCSNNQKNKDYLTGFIEQLFLPKLEEDASISNITILLNKLIENNKMILLHEARSRLIINSVFKNFLKEKDNYFRLAFNMNTLQRFIFFKNECLKYNQNTVISNLISTTLQPIFKNLSSQNLIHTLMDDSKRQSYQFSYGDKSILLVNNRLCFAMAYLELVSNCSFDKNAFSENIAQSLLTIDDISRIIEAFGPKSNDSMISRLIIYEILKFNFHVYVDTERLYTTHISTTLLSTMKIVKMVMLKTLQFLNNGHKIKYCLSHKEMVTSSNVCIDLVFSCIDNLRIYISQVVKDANTKINKAELRELVNSSVSDLEQMHKKVTRQIVKHKIAHFLSVVQEVKSKSSFIKSNVNIEKKLTRNVASILKGSEKNELFKHISDVGNIRESQLFTIMRQNLLFSKRNFQKQLKLQSTRFEVESKSYLMSNNFDEFSDQEFKKLISWPNQPEKREFFEKFLENLVPYMDPDTNTNSHVINLGLTVYKNYADPDFGTNEDEFKKQRRIKIRQNFLIKIGVVELVCKLISRYDDFEVFSAAINVGVKILEGGNVEGQNEFLRIFKKLEGEDIISKIIKIMSSNFNKIAISMVKLNNSKLKTLVLGPNFKEFIGLEYSRYENPDKTCKLIFKFFQLLCEGHNSDLQNHLRIGTGFNEINKVKSDENNAISAVSALFGSYIKFFNSKSWELGEVMIDFMIETVQGPCRGNQTEMINSKVVVFCKDFLNDLNSSAEDLKIKGFHIDSVNKKEADEHQDILNKLFSTTIQLLLSILESNRNQKVMKKIGKSVRFKFLIDKLSDIFYGYMEEKKISARSMSIEGITMSLDMKHFEEDMTEAFDIFFFMQTINENTSLYHDDIKHLDKLQKKAYDFFSKNTGTIEIIFEDQLQKVYFMKHPTTNYLDKEHKVELMNKVRRDNPNEKITDFFSETPILFDKMNHTFGLAKDYKLKAIYLSILRNMTLILSVIICFYIYLEFDLEIEQQVVINTKRQALTLFFQVCQILHLAMSALMVIMQIMIKSQLILMDKWRIYFSKFRIMLRQVAKDDNLKDQLMLATLQKNVSDITFSERLKIIKMRRQMEMGTSKLKIMPLLNYVTKNLIFILSDKGFIYFIFYLTCSVFARVNNIPVLYAYSLFEIIVSY